MRLKGHKKEGMAADIHKKQKFSRTSEVQPQGHKKEGMAADIPKQMTFNGIIGESCRL